MSREISITIVGKVDGFVFALRRFVFTAAGWETSGAWWEATS